MSPSGWAHVVCALYIPEVQFANVLTMEPIILQYVPHERYIKVLTHTLWTELVTHCEVDWTSVSKLSMVSFRYFCMAIECH